jgi:hypothetical protein
MERGSSPVCAAAALQAATIRITNGILINSRFIPAPDMATHPRGALSRAMIVALTRGVINLKWNPTQSADFAEG